MSAAGRADTEPDDDNETSPTESGNETATKFVRKTRLIIQHHRLQQSPQANVKIAEAEFC